MQRRQRAFPHLRLALYTLLSACIHGVVLMVASSAATKTHRAPSKPVALAIRQREPPPDPKPETPLPSEPAKIAETIGPEPTRPSPKTRRRPRPVEDPKDPPQPPTPPKATPPTFALDMESTVVGGEGPEVPTTQGTSTPKADPKAEPRSKPMPVGTGGADNDGSDDDGVHETGGGSLTMPKFALPAHELRPEYPRRAQELEIEGVVALRVFVGVDGRVLNTKLIQGIGHGCDEATLVHAKKKWRFVPATKDGVPVGRWIRVDVRFELER